MGVTELPVSAEHLTTTAIGRQELVAILPPGARGPRRGDLTDLARRPLVMLPVGTSTRDTLDTAFAAVGATAIVAVETDQREAIVPLVVAGAGAALVPAPMAVMAREQGAVVTSLRPAAVASAGPGPPGRAAVTGGPGLRRPGHGAVTNPSPARALAIVAVGGAIGAPLRYVIEDAAAAGAGELPVATLAINIAGAFALGCSSWPADDGPSARTYACWWPPGSSAPSPRSPPSPASS